MQPRLEQPRPRRRLRLTLASREALWAYAFLLIPLAFYLVLRIYPAIQSLWLSLIQLARGPRPEGVPGARLLP